MLARDQDPIFTYLQGGVGHALQPITELVPYVIMQLIIVYGIQIYTREHGFRWHIICDMGSLLLMHTD